MLLCCLKAELMKCRRSPVWLAFLVLPLFPAILGTFNYLGNQEVLDSSWYSLWTQHTLFASMFFLPAQFGVFCGWQWRLEHTDHNWNSLMTAPGNWLLFGALGGVSVCAVQLFFSLAIRAFAPPVAIGLVGGILGLLVTSQGWGYGFPYSLLCIGMRANNPTMEMDLLPFLLSVLAYTVVFTGLSIRYLRRRDVAAE